jgi:hypothetical protein
MHAEIQALINFMQNHQLSNLECYSHILGTRVGIQAHPINGYTVRSYDNKHNHG